jgi:hypothetical protein
MKTIVYQSFRTENVPAWISTCLDSVREWAKRQGFAYQFFDDSFFDFVPRDVYPRAREHVCMLADYARLVAAKRLLTQGWERVIWLDADALVFNPAEFTIPVVKGYAFCREVWMDRVAFGRPQFKLTVNNAVSVFCQDQAVIDFYLDSANAILRSDAPLNALSIGTDFLVKLQRARKFPLLTNVGIFGPEMTFRYLQDDERFLRPYLNYQTSPIYAANLCLSHHQEVFHFSGTGKEGWELNEQTLLNFIGRLQADGGKSLNRWFDRGYSPAEWEFDRPLSRFIGTRHALKSLALSLQGK